QEDNRPYNHFSALFAPFSALDPPVLMSDPGTCLEPSPLRDAELPDWVLFHFQTSEESGWESPQVLSSSLTERLKRAKIQIPPMEKIQDRARLVSELGRHFPHRTLVAMLQPHNPQPGSRENTVLMAQNPWNYNAPAQPDVPNKLFQSQSGSEFAKRADVQKVTRNQSKMAVKGDELDTALAHGKRNGEDWFTGNRLRPAPGESVAIHLDSMIPLWLPSTQGQDFLLFARLVQIGQKQVCQGIVLDW